MDIYNILPASMRPVFPLKELPPPIEIVELPPGLPEHNPPPRELFPGTLPMLFHCGGVLHEGAHRSHDSCYAHGYTSDRVLS